VLYDQFCFPFLWPTWPTKTGWKYCRKFTGNGSPQAPSLSFDQNHLKEGFHEGEDSINHQRAGI
jgi:hypothetical protein